MVSVKSNTWGCCRLLALTLICLLVILAPEAQSQNENKEVAFIGITCPPDTTVECPDDAPPPDIARVTIVTTCPPATVTFVSDVWAPGHDLLVRTYAAVDACGQRDTASQAIIISDKTPPVITCPANITVSCPDDVPAPNVNAVVATDNCEVAEVVFVGDVESRGTCPKIITRTYRAYDMCANSATCQQIITVDDNTPPVLVGAPSDVTVLCGQIPAPPVVTATDNCDLSVIPVYSQSTPPTSCSGSFTRRWIATDDCGNADTATQTITVIDNVDPVLVGAPSDVTVLCGQIPTPPAVTATDNCDPSVVPLYSQSTPPTGCSGTFTRRWIATDDCGNADTAIQTITVIDNVDPVLVGYPSDVTVSCGQIPAPPVVTAIDNCDLSVIPVYSQSTAPAQCGTFTRRWIATDDCGNADTAVQTITVVDSIDPVLVGAPIDVTVLCGQIPAPPSVTATDNCDPSVVPVYSQSTPPTGCSGSFTRRWIATDDCGNADTAVQTITVIDDVDPVLVGAPIDVTVLCGQIPAPPVVTATDNCDLSVIPVLSESTRPTGCSGSFTRRWIATDDCGNADTAVQTLTVIDDVDPVLVGAPIDITVACGQIPAPPVVTATDNCDLSVIPVYSQSTLPTGCSGVFTRQWIATDDCGNADTAVQTITVIDNIDPVLVGTPSDVTVLCGQIPAPPVVTATDNCDLSVIPVFSQSTPPTGCSGSFTRQWIATDDCGNADTSVQTITVIDNVDPLLVGCPNDTTINCGDVVADANVSALDNCDHSVAIAFAQSAVPAQCGSFTRTWIATDDCGNADTCIQTVTVIDNVDPVLVGCPDDITVFCNQIPPPALVSATDACDPSVVPVYSESTFPTDCDGIITRRWIATDDCGNADTCEQIITIIPPPPPPPVVVCPNDTIVSCPTAVPAPNPSLVQVTDGCAPVVEWLGDVITVPGACNGVVTRTYRAIDTCGFADTCVQVFRISDGIDPVLVGCPNDTTVHCDDIPDATAVTATDNCDTSVVPVLTQSAIPAQCGSFTRRWVATDDCGNADTCIQTITVIDDVDPLLVGCPNDTLIRCGPLPPVAIVTAFDNCDLDVQIVFAESSFKLGDCRSVVRTWIAVDECGNADTCDQIIKVIDYIPPTLVGCPSDTTVLCGQVPPPAVVTATDDCDTSVTPVFTQVPLVPQCPGTITRRWVATDGCGNADTCEQVITVIVPPPPPPSVQCPPDTTVSCRSAVPAPDTARVQETGDCGQLSVVWVRDIASGPGSCNVTISRTYRVVDTCGGSDSCVQLIHVNDTVDPTLVGCPNDTTVFCGDVPPVAIVTAYDNCDPSVTPVFSQTTPLDVCELIIRRWIATDDCGNADTCEQVITRRGSTGVCDTLCGTVYNTDCPGTTCLVADAYVQLWDAYPDGSVISTDTTDASGNFCFDVLPGIEYDLRIYKQGFCTDVFLDARCGDELVLGLDSLDFVLPESPLFHDFWSTNAMTEGHLILPGDVIYACDSNGVIIGLAYVKVPGEYLIHVSGNAPKGPPDLIDEGADPGEIVSLWLNCECPLPAPSGFVNFASTMFDADWTCDPVTVSEINCELCPGWNMFSYNLYLTNYSRESVLTSLELNYDAVRSGFCPAVLVSWFEGRPINDLVSVPPWYGYDIHTTAWDTLNLVGNLIPANTPIALCEGWNYIPYYPTEPDSRLHALASIAGNYTNVFNLWCDNFDSYNSSRPDGANDLFCLYPCRGYWIKMTVADTLIYPTDGYDCNEPLAKMVPSYNSGQIVGSPIVADFWSNADVSTSGLNAGDVITVRTESGMLVGEAQVGDRGMFLVHIFGDVSSTAAVEGAQPGETLTFEVNGLAASVDGNSTFNDRENSQITVRVSGATPVPNEYSLLQNYPNPFNAGTVIPFTMKDASDWTLTVYNILGQVVRTFEGYDAPGTVNVNWNGVDQSGATIPSGVYFYRVTTDSWSATRKMTLLK